MNEREAGAMKIVHRYMVYSAGAGLIPLAGLDVTVLAGIHVSLIKQLCDYYEVEFSEHTARPVLVAILASMIPGTLGSLVSRRTLALLPFVTHVVGLAGMSAFSALVSYGLGKIFIRHFESGGTLRNFDVEHLKSVVSHLRHATSN
jgi:uncharacterized protein (DUF697 family)